MQLEGSDKGNGWHNYTKFYHAMFCEMRYAHFSLFELGMGSTNASIKSSMGPKGKPGASLRAWARYFPNAKIFGADYDPFIVGGPYDSDRITTAWVDQTDPQAIGSLWDEVFTKEFDIIIEDGLHEADANMIFLENSHHKLAPEGVYVIEDIVEYEAEYLLDRLRDFCGAHGFQGRMLTLPHDYKAAPGVNWGPIDNRLAVLVRNSDIKSA